MSQDEVVHFELFREVIVDQVFADAGLVHGKNLMLQAVHEEPAVWHAAIALSAIDRTDSNLQFALRQYAKSMTLLNKILESGHSRSIEAALICSLLSISFDILHGSHKMAQTHLENALSIVGAYRGTRGKLVSIVDSPNVLASIVDPAIAEVFLRLDLQACSYLGQRLPKTLLGLENLSMDPFQTLDAASCALHRILGNMWALLRSFEGEDRYQTIQPASESFCVLIRGIRLDLHCWKVMFDTLSESKYSPKAAGEAGIDGTAPRQALVLEINYLASIIMLAGSLDPIETLYDSHCEEFARIVSCSEQVISNVAPEQPIKNFSLATGIIQPLYLTVIKRRDGNVRREALRLLSGMKTQEGIWNSNAMAAIAGEVMRLEESGLIRSSLQETGIPESWRVHSVDTSIDALAGQANFSCRLLPNGIDGEWHDVPLFVKWRDSHS